MKNETTADGMQLNYTVKHLEAFKVRDFLFYFFNFQSPNGTDLVGKNQSVLTPVHVLIFLNYCFFFQEFNVRGERPSNRRGISFGRWFEKIFLFVFALQVQPTVPVTSASTFVCLFQTQWRLATMKIKQNRWSLAIWVGMPWRMTWRTVWHNGMKRPNAEVKENQNKIQNKFHSIF